jgi:hypothetical protein
MSTTARINRLVRQAIPKGKPARIMWYPTGFSKSQILRVVTPAWRTLPRFQRISRLRETLEPNLTRKERAMIFRISVLTVPEFKRLLRALPAGHANTSKRSTSNGNRRLVAT